MRIATKERVILELLRDAEQYGLQLVESSRGHLKRGTVYVTLGRMEEKGYVASRQEDAPPGQSGLPRRMYRITGLGRRVLAAWEMVEAPLALARTR
jgi:DNA-binding PadR family transcriptional regulator